MMEDVWTPEAGQEFTLFKGACGVLLMLATDGLLTWPTLSKTIIYQKILTLNESVNFVADDASSKVHYFIP